MESDIFVCDCHSLEHQLQVWYDEEEKEVRFCPHLTTYRGFCKRLWHGLKYAFGYKCRYGAWDEMVLKKEDGVKLINFLQK